LPPVTGRESTVTGAVTSGVTVSRTIGASGVMTGTGVETTGSSGSVGMTCSSGSSTGSSGSSTGGMHGVVVPEMVLVQPLLPSTSFQAVMVTVQSCIT